jgi:nucleoside-diphosphate-sugar epimerase
MKKHIAVFGASGKIGAAVTEALLEEGHAVTALQHARPVPDGCRIVEGSVSDFEVVQRALGNNEIVLQLATTKGDREHFLDVAVGGTFQILDAVRRRGGCEQFVLAGGDCALGIWFYRHIEPLTEASPLRAYPGYYPLSKVLEETLTLQHHYQYGIPFTILQMGWVHRPDTILKPFLAGRVAGKTWQNAFRDRMAPELQARVDGEGTGFVVVAVDRQGGTPIRRTTVSYEDVVQAWLLAIGNPLARNQVFNVVHPAWDYSVVGAFLSDELGVPAERVPLDAHSWEMDTTKIRTVLGWRPKDDVFSLLGQALARLQST